VTDPELTLTVNGTQHRLAIDARSMLAETLRDELGLTGTKRGCDRGECGACTVLVNGRRVLSCMTLALLADGAEVISFGDRLYRRGTPDPPTKSGNG